MKAIILAAGIGSRLKEYTENIPKGMIVVKNKTLIENIPKFILIDSADDMNINSSNALLKILEEPRLNTYFF